jgi:phosphatidylserine decarboxylase
MARDGYPYVGAGSASVILLSISGNVFEMNLLFYFAGFCGVLTLFFMMFFRDPERVTDAGPGEIVSPGDGHVVAIVEEEEPDYFQTKIKRVSIFLSVFDVHINRIPINGSVEYYRYSPGAFKVAYKDEASADNEQTVIGISNGSGKVLFKQIAGLVARRIVCTLKEGQLVTAGERFGLIKFGSRVDVCVPVDTEILVSTGQKVTGGITVVGRFTNDK